MTADDPCLPHQAGNLLPAAPNATVGKFCMNPRRAVRLTTLVMDYPNPLCKHSILLGSLDP
jgi:hypothetical protein